jgi:hypothetical protein
VSIDQCVEITMLLLHKHIVLHLNNDLRFTFTIMSISL